MMQRTVTLEGGPVGLRTATVTKPPGGEWPTEFGLVRNGVKLSYRRRTNSLFVYAGEVPIPREEPVVQIVRDQSGWQYVDPTGRQSYSDLPVPPADCADTDAFFRELFAGGMTHWSVIDRRDEPDESDRSLGNHEWAELPPPERGGIRDALLRQRRLQRAS